jgi:hypothetical protein
MVRASFLTGSSLLWLARQYQRFSHTASHRGVFS